MKTFFLWKDLRQNQYMKTFFLWKDLRQNQCSNPHLHATQPKEQLHMGANQTSDFEFVFSNALKINSWVNNDLYFDYCILLMQNTAIGVLL